MTTRSPTGRSDSDVKMVRPRWATAATFAINGLLTGSFASRIPALKSTLSVSDSVLGRTLFAIAAGSLVSLQLAGRIVTSNGSRRASLSGAFITAVGLAAAGASSNLLGVAVSLFIYGAGLSLLDVAMNSQAVLVEQSYRRPIMSSFHAMFSAGALVGAAGGAIGAHFHLDQQLQYVLTGAFGAVTLSVSIASMSTIDRPDELGVPAAVVETLFDTVVEPTPSRPTGSAGSAVRSVRATILMFGVIAFAGLLSEGAAADWSGVHLRDSLHWTESAAARGFVTFQAFMTLGRTFGDRVVAALGPRRTLIRAAIVAAVGFSLGLVTHNGWAFVAGLGMLGLGLAVIVPVVFSAAAAQPGETGTAIARVSTIGYAGFLVGPPLIGQIAQWTSTGWALALLPLLCSTIIVLTLIVTPKQDIRHVAAIAE